LAKRRAVQKLGDLSNNAGNLKTVDVKKSGRNAKGVVRKQHIPNRKRFAKRLKSAKPNGDKRTAIPKHKAPKRRKISCKNKENEKNTSTKTPKRKTCSDAGEESTPSSKRRRTAKSRGNKDKAGNRGRTAPSRTQIDAAACCCFFEILPVELLSHIFHFVHSFDLLNCGAVCKIWRYVVKDEILWKRKSVERWGELVLKAQPQNWLLYFLTRAGRVTEPLKSISSFGLIQERYCHDPWHMLAAVILIQRTNGSEKVRDAIANFFEHFPSPKVLLEADCSAKNAETVAELIHPCGLQKIRVRALLRFSEEFLTCNWQLPDELFGVGQLGRDSYLLFCLGKKIETKDLTLRAYQRWREKKKDTDDEAPSSSP